MINDDVVHLEQRLKENPTHPEYNRLMGSWYQHNNEAEKAIPFLQPYARNHKAYMLILADCYMSVGDLDKAWEWYKTRPRNLDRQKPVKFAPRWNGEPLGAGKRVLIISEQQFGDGLFHYRFVKLLQKTYPECLITYCCHYELRELYYYQKDFFRVIHFGCPELSEQFDYYAFDDDLPFFFRETFDGEPWESYLKAPVADLELDRSKVNVGVVWESRFGNKGIPIFDIDRIIGIDGIEFYSLQKDASYCPFIDLSNRLTDFLETAKIINQLDLIVSTCTAASHLAGALGRPIVLLGPYKTFWPYKCAKAKGKESHRFWYPTMDVIPMKGNVYYDSITRLMEYLEQYKKENK